MTYQVLLQASLYRHDRFSVKKLWRRDSFSCQQGRFGRRDFLTSEYMSGFFRHGMISDNFFTNLPTHFFEKLYFEKKLIKILGFHSHGRIFLKILHKSVFMT